MSAPRPRIVRGTADLIGDVGDFDLVVLQASRREVEAQNISSMLERLMALSDNRETVLCLQEKVLLHFDGFDGDPREVSEIPEIRSFMRMLVDQWPHWFWFLAREQGTISLFMSLICKVRIHRQGTRFGIEFTDPDELRMCFDNLAHRSVAMFEMHEIPPEDAIRSLESAVAALGA